MTRTSCLTARSKVAFLAFILLIGVASQSAFPENPCPECESRLESIYDESLVLPQLAVTDRIVRVTPTHSEVIDLHIPHAWAETATAFNDSLFLIAGGRDENGDLSANVILLDASFGQLPASSMPEPRARHEVVALEDGSFLVVGGTTVESDGAVCLARDILRYQPLTDEWSIFAQLPLRAASLAAERVGSRLFVIAGVSGPTAEPESAPAPAHTRDDVQILDLVTGQWSFGQPKITPEAGVTSTVYGQEVFVVSSWDDYCGRISARVEAYHTISDTWRSLPEMPTPRTGVPTAFLGGKLYAINGQGRGLQVLSLVEVFDPGTQEWTQVDLAPPACFASGYAQVNDSTIVLFGGRVQPDYGTGGTSSIWEEACRDCELRLEAIYDDSLTLPQLPITNRIVRVTPTQSEVLDLTIDHSWGETAAAFNDSLFLVAGGRGSNGDLSSAVVLLDAVFAQRPASPMPEPRARHEVVALEDGSFLVVGGTTVESDGAVCLARDILRYQPLTDEWSIFAQLPLRAASLAAERVGSRLFVIAGVSGPTAEAESPSAPAHKRDDVQILDLTTGDWSFGQPKITAEGGVTSAVLGDEIYVVSSDENYCGRINALVEIYDTGNNSWRAAASMPTARTTVPTAFLGGKLYAVNGLGRGRLALPLVEVYDSTIDAWSRAEHAPPACFASGYAALNDTTLILFGGRVQPDFGTAPTGISYPLSQTGYGSRLGLGAQPNPFSTSTDISFTTTTAGSARLDLYDATGRRIMTLTDRYFAPGRHTMTLNRRDSKPAGLKSGIYFARIHMDGVREDLKLIVIE